jgi:hypothetical protein
VTLDQFVKASDLLALREIEKVRLLSFFFFKTANNKDFTVADVLSWFSRLSLPAPNRTRLVNALRSSKAFTKGIAEGTWRLHAIELDELQGLYPGLASTSEEVISDDTILPHALYAGTRGFIESLARQINASFEYNIFDGCAVLMRRLLEVLLILSYEHSNIEKSIQDADGNYRMLEAIVADAKSNSVLRLSRNTKSGLDAFRVLGNFSAHKIYFNCRRSDLTRVTAEYRAMIEELLYKAGIRT